MTKIIVSCDRHLTEQQSQRVKEMLKEVFPADQGLVMDGGFKVQAMPLTRREQFAVRILAGMLAAPREPYANFEAAARREWLARDALAQAEALERAL